MNKKIITILIFMILLLCSFVSADAQLYLTKGVTRDANYQQDGVGVWDGRTSTNYQRVDSYGAYTSPLVSDIDNDGLNEIVVMKNNFLQILNYTTGVGLILEATYDIKDITFTFNTFYQTPGLIDYDSDNKTEIIVFNTTHVMTLEHNGTSINLEQSKAHNIVDGTGFTQYAYPVIRCGTNLLFESNTYNCLFVSANDTGPTVDTGVVNYDLTNNLVYSSFTLSMIDSDKPASSPLVDVDADGYLELVFAEYAFGVSNGLKVHKAEINSSNAVIISTLNTHTETAPSSFTDIIVNNLDGTLSDGREITYGYTSDGVNWDARTLHGDGSAYQNSYCGITSCPEGEASSVNLFESPDDYYAEFSGDVCYYIRNEFESFPGPNTDVIMCLSLIAGADWQGNDIPNTENFEDSYPYIHYSSVMGKHDVLLSNWIISDGVKKDTPELTGNSFIIPVDYQLAGSLDLIGISSTRLIYYDDAVVNQNMEVTSISPDTGNPVCQNEIVTISTSVTDDLNDFGYCHIQEMYGNNTQKQIHDNKSVSSPSSFSLNYLASDVGTFILNIRCRDQFHTSYNSLSYTISISNDTVNCNHKFQNPPPPTNVILDDEQEADEEFKEKINDSLEDVGMESGIGKFIFIMILMILVGAWTAGGLPKDMPGKIWAVMGAEVVTLVIGWKLGLVSAVPLVIIGLFFGFAISIFMYSLFSGTGTN